MPQAWIDQVVRNNTLKGAQDTSDLRKSIKEELIGREVLADQGDVQQYKPSLIVVQTEDEAKLILKQLQSGQAFEKLAQAKSIDQSKSAGGDLGWILPSQIATAISNVMVNLTKGRS